MKYSIPFLISGFVTLAACTSKTPQATGPQAQVSEQKAATYEQSVLDQAQALNDAENQLYIVGLQFDLFSPSTHPEGTFKSALIWNSENMERVHKMRKEIGLELSAEEQTQDLLHFKDIAEKTLDQYSTILDTESSQNPFHQSKTVLKNKLELVNYTLNLINPKSE